MPDLFGPQPEITDDDYIRPDTLARCQWQVVQDQTQRIMWDIETRSQQAAKFDITPLTSDEV